MATKREGRRGEGRREEEVERVRRRVDSSETSWVRASWDG